MNQKQYVGLVEAMYRTLWDDQAQPENKEDVSDPSNGKFAYKVNWENGKSDWMEETDIHKKGFFESLLQKFK